MKSQPQPPKIFEEHFIIKSISENPTSLISEKCDLSKQKSKDLLQKGCVWVTRNNKTKRIKRASKALKAGDQVHLYYNESVLNSFPTPAQLVHDKGTYTIWVKPYGMYSQGSKWGDHCTIYRWAEQHLLPQRPAFIVHRLDRAANGLMILAHSKTMAATLSKMFQNHEIEKIYEAIVHGELVTGPFPLKVDTPVQQKTALSFIESQSYNKKTNTSKVRVKIETGRKHQIRIHLSELGHPIVGDRLYGIGNESLDLQLTSKKLKFICPVEGIHKEFLLPD